MYWLEWFKSLYYCKRETSQLRMSAYFLVEFVTKVRTSWFSSSSNMVPRYPRRLSANRGEASSFRHSICPKCVLSPSVKRYSSLATLFLLLGCECTSVVS